MAYEHEQFGEPGAKRGMSTIAKVAIGCGAVLGVLILLCVGLGVVGVVKAKKYAEQVEASMKEVRGEPGTEVGALLQEADAANPFQEPTPPATDAESIDRFFRIRDRTMSRARALEEVFLQMGQMDGKKRPSLREIFGAVGKMANAPRDLAEIRKDFGRALKEEGMSQDGYIFHLRLLFLSGIVEGSVREQSEGSPGLVLEGFEEVPEEIRTLVTGYGDRIRKDPASASDAFIIGKEDAFDGRGSSRGRVKQTEGK